jgi:hypothetical protein
MSWSPSTEQGTEQETEAPSRTARQLFAPAATVGEDVDIVNFEFSSG